MENFHENQLKEVNEWCEEFKRMNNLQLDFKIDCIDTEYRSWYKEILYYFGEDGGQGSLTYYSKDGSIKIESKIKDVKEEIGKKLIHELSRKIKFIQ